MLVGTLSFSLIAPVSALSRAVDPVLLLSCGSFISIFIHGFFIKGLFQKLKTCPKKLYLIVFVGGSIGGWSFVLLTMALRMSENAIVPSLMFELYPITTILLAGVLLQKEKIRLSHWFWMLVCVLGLAVLMLDGQEISLSGLMAGVLNQWTVAGLALTAVVLRSLGILSAVAPSRMLGGTAQDGIFMSFLLRVTHFAITLPFANWSQLSTFSNQSDWQSFTHIAVYGVFVHALTNIMYYSAVNINKSNMVHMMMYMAPVFSAMWLALLGLGSFTLATVLGGGLIVLAVLRITLARQSPAS